MKITVFAAGSRGDIQPCRVTVSFDHDIIDGAPAACFTERLKTLIESRYGLDELEKDLAT